MQYQKHSVRRCFAITQTLFATPPLISTTAEKNEPDFILDDEQKNDYTAVDGLISKMKLTAAEYETLCAYMAGLTYLEVTRFLNVNRTTIWRRRMNLQRKYTLATNNI